MAGGNNAKAEDVPVNWGPITPGRCVMSRSEVELIPSQSRLQYSKNNYYCRLGPQEVMESYARSG